MDPVTHALLGAGIGYAACGNKLGRSAALVGGLAGIAPDIDHFVSSERDPLLYLEYHRFFTHALAFAPVGAWVSTWPWLMAKRLRAQAMTLWLCALPAYLSHCLLDACTTWGTQLYWPFTRDRVGWDFIAIVDPALTLALLLGLGWAVLRRTRAPAVVGLCVGAAYILWGAVQRERAERAQDELARARGHAVERGEVMPTIGNNILWRSLYLADGRLYIDRLRVGWASGATFRAGVWLSHLTPDRLLPLERAANESTRGYDRFAWFSGGWLARSPADPGVIGDARYSKSAEVFDPVWGIRFEQEGDGHRVVWVNEQTRRRVDARELWAEIRGHDARFIPISAAGTGR
jgi:inner membrane protein